MSFVASFQSIKELKPFKPPKCDIDNGVFKLHYRWTMAILMVSTILVTSRQYIGEHIRCIADKGVPEHVMNTFCFFTTTFTVIKHMNSTSLDAKSIPHPGVGPMSYEVDPVKRHAYYQWVPFVLFGQALMFCITKFIWKKLEGNKIKALADGLQSAAYAFLEKPMVTKKDEKEYKIPTKADRQKAIEQIRKAFMDRMYINGRWSIYLIGCEFLNVLHVLLQFYITNKFLNDKFYDLGPTMIREGLEDSVTVLDEVFPKVTKCNFHKYGPSGSIQLHDAMCVMALNIVNEKIYGFLWFWFMFLLIASVSAVIWRGLTIFLHAKSKAFNRFVFSNTCPGKLNPWENLTVSRHCNYTDWLFLKYLSKNIDGLVFKEVFLGIAEDLEEKKPLIDIESN
ncbi:innexin inx7 [Aethina tumida]|uniref:innexin inx7 n=1 Tax=Aethina tumida TaxID=116153 RepID=UPI00096B1019|nr:innexin inx7 [Aethina tumida]XP_019871477.1 innexin inx7 [Aethina tumida]XP_019871478.1 innexin inx7 [Aethina tumida]